MDQDGGLLEAYRATRWTVAAAGGAVELVVGRRVETTAVPLPAAVITAYNPRSVQRSSGENEVAQRELERSLRAEGLRYVPTLAHGTGTEATEWDEPGVLVTGVEMDAAVALAGRYEQNAILWIGRDGIPVLVAARPGFAGAAPGAHL